MQKEVKSLLEAHGAETKTGDFDRVVDRVVDKTSGQFALLYLKREPEQNSSSDCIFSWLDAMEHLPDTLDDFYLDTFKRLFPLDEETDDNKTLAQLRPVLQVIVAAQRVLSVTELACVVSQEVRSVLRLLKPLGGLLEPMRRRAGHLDVFREEDLVNVHHKSVRDWLVKLRADDLTTSTSKVV